MTSQKTIEIRALRSDELDAVTGGVLDNCIRLPSILVVTPPSVPGFIDQFAKRVPSWVR